MPELDRHVVRGSLLDAPPPLVVNLRGNHVPMSEKLLAGIGRPTGDELGMGRVRYGDRQPELGDVPLEVLRQIDESRHRFCLIFPWFGMRAAFPFSFRERS